MHDPKTIAFEIYLGKKKRKDNSYRSPLVTIWHNDPETDGTDDSCGWVFPKVTKEEHLWLDEVAKEQYSTLFQKTVAVQEQKSYADICHNQDVYGVIYWMWRFFNATSKKKIYQYGGFLSNKEIQYVYEMATSPMDNFQHHKCQNETDFRNTIFLIFRCWKAFHRKWYQHPKWHIHHWSIQFHPIQKIKRRYWDKCSICGKRGFKGAAMGDWGGTKLWHQECDHVVNKETHNSFTIQSNGEDWIIKK